MTKKLIVRIPSPHTRQSEVESCEASRIVVPAGRRAGKTTMVARKSIYKASDGRRVLYTAPTNVQTDAYWGMCSEWLSDAILTKMVNKNETKRTLTFHGGGEIVARTAYKPDHLRGTYADFLIMDEYAYANPEIWTKVGSPMLLDNDGDAWFISSPDRRNHFYHLWLKAQNEPDWAAFTFSSLDNPHLPAEALRKLTADMTEEDYNQEILAQFVEGLGSVFSFNMDDFIPAVSMEPHLGHRLVAGLDWGQTDFSALSIGCADCSKELYLERFKGPYPAQRDRIQDILDPLEGVELLAESNSIGQPNIEQMREDGTSVEGFAMTSTSKPQVVQAMRLVLSRREWQWVDDPIAMRELEAYEMKKTAGGSYQYNAPSGLNDDTIVARMLMLRQAIYGTRTLV